MTRPLWFPAIVVLLALASAARAQDLARQPTAYTAYMDFQHPSQDLPIWIERVETDTIQADGTNAAETVYRIRFRRFAGLVDEVALRVYFGDTPGAQPVVTAWNEIGERMTDPVTLGQGLGLPSSQTLKIPMAGVDYIDIQTPGEGGGVRGALAVALRDAGTSEALDFGGTAEMTDPFGNAAPVVTATDDVLLYGRVMATLEPGVVPLDSSQDGGGAAIFDFPLEKPPLVALLTFEILNADIGSPPVLTVNGQDGGAVNVSVPDLADPALTGAAEPGRPDVVYRYAGWLKCQKVIPGSLLLAGSNELIISTPGQTTPVALRSVEVQLKYTQDATSP